MKLEIRNDKTLKLTNVLSKIILIVFILMSYYLVLEIYEVVKNSFGEKF